LSDIGEILLLGVEGLRRKKGRKRKGKKRVSETRSNEL